jgi:hypothetical protein
MDEKSQKNLNKNIKVQDQEIQGSQNFSNELKNLEQKGNDAYDILN